MAVALYLARPIVTFVVRIFDPPMPRSSASRMPCPDRHVSRPHRANVAVRVYYSESFSSPPGRASDRQRQDVTETGGWYRW